MQQGLNVAVVIATTGRAVILSEALRELAVQSTPPALVAICPAKDEDIDLAALVSLPLRIRLSRSETGASVQRNALLRDMPHVDIVLFLDDDFFPAPDYLEALAQIFEQNPDVALVTGSLIADGATGPGFSPVEARRMISAASRDRSNRIDDVFCGYGCNMAVRWSIIAEHGLRFDESLPFYSWAEDIEFSRQVAPYGRLVRSGSLRGVHLATKRGRTSGLRLGYSQVANQVYLHRKGVITARWALVHCCRNVLANLRGLILSETYVDRRGRLLGNLYGLADLLRGRSSPLRIRDL